MHWCRITDNSWSRTVLHGKGHWSVLTIHRTSDMSWVHFAKMKNHLTRKVRFEGTPKIGPVLEVTTSYLQGKYGVEIRIESVHKDDSHSWVRSSHGLNNLVTDLSNKEDDDKGQETSEMKFEEFALKTNVLAFASRSKAKAIPRRRTSACSSTRILHNSWKILDWCGARNLFASRLPSVKTTEYSSSSWSSTSRRRWSNWILELLGISSERSCAISTLVWWNVEEQNGRRRRKQEKISILYWSIRTRNSLSPSSSRSFRTQSHWSFTTGQCVNYERFLRVHLSHRMCNQFNTPSQIQDWYREDKIWAKENRQYSLRLWIRWTRNTKIRMRLTWKHHVLHGTSTKTGEDIKTVYWVDIQHVQPKEFKFYQTRSNAIIFYDTLPAYCISKVVVTESGEIIHEKVYASPRLPPKNFFEDNWMKEVDS